MRGRVGAQLFTFCSFFAGVAYYGYNDDSKLEFQKEAEDIYAKFKNL